MSATMSVMEMYCFEFNRIQCETERPGTPERTYLTGLGIEIIKRRLALLYRVAFKVRIP